MTDEHYKTKFHAFLLLELWALLVRAWNIEEYIFVFLSLFLLGRAIKHVKETIFTPEAGARRGVPKVLVVLTDGRSQDDVNKVSKEMQMDGLYRVCRTVDE